MANEKGSVGFDSDLLYVSTQRQYTSFEALQSNTLGFRKSRLYGHLVIELKDLVTLRFNERVPDFRVTYRSENGKIKKCYLNISDNALRKDFCTDLADTAQLKTQHEHLDRWAQLPINLALLIITIGATWFTMHISQNDESHARRASAWLMQELCQTIGPWGCLAICGSIAAFFMFRILRNILHPRKTINYSIL